MSRNIELRELLDVYEKEGIMNNRLKVRRENINEFHNDIDNEKVHHGEIKVDDSHLTLERGGKVLVDKISRHKYWLHNLYLAHRIQIYILCMIVLFILFFKIVNK